MFKEKFIKSYLENAKTRLDFIKLALKDGKYDYVIRECQEVVELCSKALIYSQGMVVPKIHNMAKEIDEIKDLFSENFQKEMPNYYILIRKLYSKRELAMYGDEVLGIPSTELFTKEDAKDYSDKTIDYYTQCLLELETYLKLK